MYTVTLISAQKNYFKAKLSWNKIEKLSSNLEIRTQKRASDYVLDEVERQPSEKEYYKLLS